jgi:deoxyribodipyrimidine photo-lyase
VRLATWVESGLDRYGADRDHLSGNGTSRLGADLHFGLLSPRQVEEAAARRGEVAEPFLRQLAWREFYHHVLFDRVRVRHGGAEAEGNAAVRPERSAPSDPDAIAAWKAGRTGVPAVDAGMRQLAATAWMSNRARLVAATFLTRHLGVDHRVGEAHFMAHLVDGDVADNRGGWEWVAGVSPDAPPAFRIIDPVRHGQRFDPDGAWVRRWVPELARVPMEHVHAPWRMNPVEAAAIGFVLGVTYPAPIVDPVVARRRAAGSAEPTTRPVPARRT